MAARVGTLTSIVINTVGLHESYSDGPAQWVVLLLQLCLPEDGVSVLTEVLLGPMASRELAIFLAEYCHSIQAIVAHMIAGDMGQARGHHPHATPFVSWDSEKEPVTDTHEQVRHHPVLPQNVKIIRKPPRSSGYGVLLHTRATMINSLHKLDLPQGTKCSEACGALLGSAKGAPMPLCEEAGSV